MISVNMSDIFIPNGIFGNMSDNELSNLVYGKLHNVGNNRNKTHLMLLDKLIEVKQTMTNGDTSILLIHNLRDNDKDGELINRTEISFGLHPTNQNYSTVSRTELNHEK